MNTIEISVVVCTHNRAACLPACLDSLLRQTLPRNRYEILVVDNASTDDTPAVCRRYEPRGVRRIPEPVAGLSRARNTGWRNAEGALVAYLDDDAVADPQWLETALAAFQSRHPRPDGLGGPVRLIWESPAPAWMNPALQIPLGAVDWGATPRRLAPDEWVIGANCFFAKECLARLGGFDEHLGRKGSCLLSGEEALLQKQIEAGGGFLFYVPGASVGHQVTPERTRPDWFYRRYFWGGVSDARLRRRAPAGGSSSATGSVAGPDTARPLIRLALNTLAAIGLAPAPRRIQSRIYMAYVLGWSLARAGLIR
jgi:glycosyltransferase involved in cell wall biosynthesis